MKEVILEYLENGEMEFTFEINKKADNEFKNFFVQQGLKRKLLIHGWKSKIKALHQHETQKLNS